MNIALWILQALLAFFCLSGGGWKLFKQDQLPPVSKALPPLAWTAIGALEMLGALALLYPATTVIAAAVLGIDGLFLAVFYGRVNRRFVGSNPMVYALVQVVLAGIIAYGRGAI